MPLTVEEALDIVLNAKFYRQNTNRSGNPINNVFCDYCNQDGLMGSWKTTNEHDICNKCYIMLQHHANNIKMKHNNMQNQNENNNNNNNNNNNDNDNNDNNNSRLQMNGYRSLQNSNSNSNSNNNIKQSYINPINTDLQYDRKGFLMKNDDDDMPTSRVTDFDASYYDMFALPLDKM